MLIDANDNNCVLEIKQEAFHFSKKALRADILYEREHNRNIDNGVYKDNANDEDLAAMLGMQPEK